MLINRKNLALALAMGSPLIQHAVAAPVTDPNDPRNWQGATVGTFASLYFGSDTLANRQLVIDKGLLDDGIFPFAGSTAATLIKANNILGTGTSLDTDGTAADPFGYVSGGDAFVAGNSIDSKWIQSSGTVGDVVFDLGPGSTKAAVFPTIDHGPFPNESIESTVYLSNDQVTWKEAVVEKVWLEGWQPILGIKWDGFVYAVGTGTSDTFRYASIIHGGPGALQHDGDDEINGMLGLNSDFVPVNPTPDGGSTALLVGLGVASLAAASRKR